MPNPLPNEHKDEYLQRCMSDEEMKSDYPETDQRYAVCQSYWTEKKMSAFAKYAERKVSFDYDGVLSTDKGFKLAQSMSGNILYIISARREKDEMLKKAQELGIPESRVYATGSNKAKVDKIKELGINTHYDNNPDVIKELGSIGKLL